MGDKTRTIVISGISGVCYLPWGEGFPKEMSKPGSGPRTLGIIPFTCARLILGQSGSFWPEFVQ